MAELRDAGNGGTSGERLTPVWAVPYCGCVRGLEFNRLR